jgi:uncharacterized protein
MAPKMEATMTGERISTTDRVTRLDVPRRAVDGLCQALGEQLRAVVLFGSRARGDMHPDSDWDLLVIAEGLPEGVLNRYQTPKRALPREVRNVTSMLAKTPDEFEGRLPALYLDIGLDGQVLFERDGYASRCLVRLREIIHRAGLYRERTAAGDIWKWRNPPARDWSVEWES